MIRAAQLRSVSTDLNKYAAAVNTFRDKYFAIPGDMPNATSFWGLAGGDGTGKDYNCSKVKSTDAKTCNGNGDGQIYSDTTSLWVYEELRFWQHLANAGLIEGQYVGTYYNSPAYRVGKNVPATKMQNIIIAPWYEGSFPATTTGFAGNWGNALEFYSLDGNVFSTFKPEEAWNIDTKYDDGLPGTGKITANKGDATYPCTTNANNISDTGAQYSLSNTNFVCTFFLTNAF